MVGLASAAALVGAGHDVIVLDASSHRDAASWGNAGQYRSRTGGAARLAGQLALRPAAPLRRGGALDMPWRAAPAWLPFAARFVAAARPRGFRSGSDALRALLAGAMPAWRRAHWVDALLRVDGHYVVWNDPAAAAAGRAAWARADTGTATFHDASPADLARLAALSTAPIAGAIRFTGSGQVADLALLADRLEATIAAGGGRIVRTTAALRLDGRRAVVPGYPADLVLIAAGVRSRALLEGIDHRVPMIAERGYHIRTAAGDWPADMPPIVFEDRSMIVTRYADTVQAASFVELGTPDAPADPRKWERLEAHVRDLGLPVTGLFTRWMGARPTLPDYLPAIGRSPRADNLLYAFGHQHLGLTLAPVTAELVAQLAAGATPAADLAPFDLGRFGGRA